MMNRIVGNTLGVGLLLISGWAISEETDVLAIVEDHFLAADANGDGNLDRTEFPALIDANAAREIGRATMVKRFGAYERAFNTADQNSDGFVAWSEILAGRRAQGYSE